MERVYRTGEPFICSGMRALLQREPGAAAKCSSAQ